MRGSQLVDIGEGGEGRVLAKLGKTLQLANGLAARFAGVPQRGGCLFLVAEPERGARGHHDPGQPVRGHVVQLCRQPVPFGERREQRDCRSAGLVVGQRGPTGQPVPA